MSIFFSEIGQKLCQYANCTLPGATTQCPQKCKGSKVVTTSKINHVILLEQTLSLFD